MDFNLQNVLMNVFDGVYFVDRERRIIFWNRAAERITGFSAADVIGSKCSDNILMHVDEEGTLLCLHMCPLAAAMADGEARHAEVFLNHKRGHRLPVSIRAFPLRDATGATVGGAEIFTDNAALQAVTERLRELEELALLDPLTRLSNRNHLGAELEARFQEKQRYGLSFGVLFLDVDRFKRFNDDYGHAVGDEVLRIVARTLQGAARPFDVFGRWGGEEFVGIIRNVDLQTLGRMADRCRRLIAASATPVPGGGAAKVTVSIGVTLAHDEDSPESLIHRADRLMYESKLAGRNRVTLDGNPAGSPPVFPT
jgi:diguanylate cyclase (GGDEF)-like protein/PAS domain S-box-containing protein